MSPRPPSATGRGLIALASLAILALLEHLGRKDRHAMSPHAMSPAASPAASDTNLPGPAATADHDGDAARRRVRRHGDTAPGEQRTEGGDVGASVRSYLIGLALAAFLTSVSFAISYTDLIYGPAVPVALIVFALAQVGVHLVFFLHLTTAPDSINNVMALAFGTLVVLLLIAGTLWIMMHMNQNMMPAGTPHVGHR